MRQDLRSLVSPEELRRLAGMDPLVEHFLKEGRPLTRETYLAFNYPDGVEEPLDPELESELPYPLQHGWLEIQQASPAQDSPAPPASAGPGADDQEAPPPER
jgi:hypothetical protein